MHKLRKELHMASHEIEADFNLMIVSKTLTVLINQVNTTEKFMEIPSVLHPKS